MKEFLEAEIKFIDAHQQDDPAALMLQAKRFPSLHMSRLVQHIQARQKVKDKLPTWYKHPQVQYPVKLSVEQSSSERTAAFKANLVSGNILTDLTGGFGVDIFFFAKQVNEVIYVERNQELAAIAQYNAQLLGVINIQFINSEASDFIIKNQEQADWIYLDPARRDTANQKVHLLEDCEPDILQLLPLLLQTTKNVLLKTSPMLDINQAIQQLQNVHKIYVVAVDNECKEVLYHVTDQANTSPEIEAINLIANNHQDKFSFQFAEEEKNQINYSEPLAFIYEPNAAILKAGGFKSVAKQYNLNKLHRNSHLYTSDNFIPDFPGRVFKLKTISRYQKKELLKLLPDKKANITVRNFPDSVAQIRAKTGIKEGGSIYLFATTDINQRPVILVCEKAVSS